MNLIEIHQKFPEEIHAVMHFEKLRFGKKIKCVYCESTNIGKRQADLRFHCWTCRKSFSVASGTLLHGTKVPLKTWLTAFAIITNAKKGLSALQLKRDLGVSYPTAFEMYHKIRDFMREKNIDKIDNKELEGVLEMDETYVGGKPRKSGKMLLSKGEKKGYENKLKHLKKEGFNVSEGKYKKNVPLVPSKRGRGTLKTPVVGIVSRNGDVIADVVQHITSSELKEMVDRNVNKKESVLITDALPAYKKLDKIIEHIVIDHQKMWSYKGLNTNSIESFWAIIKRGIIGQYHQVSVRYLSDYVNEYVFKYNNRDKEDKMFDILCKEAIKTQ
jgi:transposase-like protein